MKPSDRRFINYWEDQRKGSRVSYYVTYIIAWGVVAFFILFFLSKLFTNLWETGGPYLGLIYIIIALISSTLITHFTWERNEKRHRRILEENKDSLN